MGLDTALWRSATLHPLHGNLSGISLPARFTYPFNYTPHPLAVIAAKELMAAIAADTTLHPAVDKGKMFGVLVIRTADGSLAYLAAFSGNINGKNKIAGYVPPVYDLLDPDGFFIHGESNISALNQRIKELERSEEYTRLRTVCASLRTEAATALAQAKAHATQAKCKRDTVRSLGLSAKENDALIRESQHEKAELRRLKESWKIKLDEAESRLKEYEQRIFTLKTERKQHSAALQTRLFREFRMLDADGRTRDLCDIFAPTAQRIPPAGAGECAAPKLLQYAYANSLHPLCIAEFWWGESPVGEIRHHGSYYPACIGKCKPILEFMLQGMAVDPDPLSEEHMADLTVIYEDEWMIAIDKPAGMLSAPGKNGTLSAHERLLRLRPDLSTLYSVHRLDMATSGVLLFAKSADMQATLQRLFRERKVEKTYMALLDGQLPHLHASISLPLLPDYLNRPRQTVDIANGKEAVTEYRIISSSAIGTLVEFKPITGRTHQLRIHAAHHLGLNAPIVGDALYGRSHIAPVPSRLHLHALSLRLVHPVTSLPLFISSAHNLFPVE